MRFTVRNGFSEGETLTIYVTPLKFNLFLLLISIILGIASLGTVILMIFWSPKLRRYLLFVQAPNVESATHFLAYNSDNKYTLIKRITVSVENKSGCFENYPGFVNRYLTYYWRDQISCFYPLEFSLEDSQAFFAMQKEPLTHEKHQLYKNSFGQCHVRVRIPTKIELFFKEVFHPFFVFQTYSCILWIYQEYTIFAIFIWIASFVSSLWNVIEIQRNYKNLRQMIEKSDQVLVKRRKTEDSPPEDIYIHNENLVPGDIIKITQGMSIPCDCILLSNKLVVNESSLTGEIHPLVKMSYPQEANVLYNHHKAKGYTLFEGSTVCSIEFGQDNQNIVPEALVIRTGFTTLKGQLIRSILYPKPYKFKFNRESYKFLGLMFLLVTLGYLGLLPKIYKYNNSTDLIVMWLDLITIAVPPSLSAAMNMATLYSIQRLKKKQIFCISPPKMIVTGRVDTCVFDKTGTITEDMMKLKGFLVNSTKGFTGFVHTSDQIDYSKLESHNELLKCFEVLGLCHGVDSINDCFYGDPMEIDLFKFSQFTILQNTSSGRIIQGLQNDKPQYIVKKLINFESKFRRMSVLVERKTDIFQKNISGNNDFEIENAKKNFFKGPNFNNKEYYYFIKGSPETLKAICLSDTIPYDYDTVLDECGSKGQRVLSLAYKLIPPGVPIDIYDDSTIRGKFDKDLIFVGFVMFDNLIKPETIETVNLLKECKLNLKVSTGDNVMTSIYVSKEAGIIPKESKVVTIDLLDWQTINPRVVFINSTQDLQQKHYEEQTITGPDHFEDKNKKIIQEVFVNQFNYEPEYPNEDNLTNSRIMLRAAYTNVLPSPLQAEILKCFYTTEILNSELALTGKAFEFIFSGLLNNFKDENSFRLLRNVLKKVKLFSRMSPNQKALLVQLLQGGGGSCLMVGDGANDTSSLKVADVGIALSNAEASVSAPFSSKIFDISCVYSLLLEGRCSLATNYQCFKFIVLYSMIEFTSVLTLYFYDATFSENHLLYIDLFLISPLFALMPIIHPSDKLSPNLPPESLFSLTCFASVLGQTVIQAVGQILLLVIMSKQSFYIPAAFLVGENDWDSLTECQETSVIFLFTNLYYLEILAVYMISKPYRKAWHSNIWFGSVYIFYWCYGIIMLLIPSLSPPLIEIVPGIPEWWRCFIGVYLLVWFGLVIAWEKYVVNQFFINVEEKRKRKMIIV